MSPGRVIVCSECKVAALMLPEDGTPAAYYWTEKHCPPCLALRGRIIAAPLPVRARAIPGYTGSNTPDISGDNVTGSPVIHKNGTYTLPGMDSMTVNDSTEATGSRGVRGDDLSRRRDIPDALREFDAILSRHLTDAPTRHHKRHYKPTTAYYGRILAKLAAIPGQYDITDAARDMIEWAALNPKKIIDWCRFSERWLETEANRRGKWSRNGRGPYQQQQTEAQRYRMGGTLADSERSSVDTLSEMGRAHYDH